MGHLSSVQLLSRVRLCDPVNRSTPYPLSNSRQCLVYQGHDDITDRWSPGEEDGIWPGAQVFSLCIVNVLFHFLSSHQHVRPRSCVDFSVNFSIAKSEREAYIHPTECILNIKLYHTCFIWQRHSRKQKCIKLLLWWRDTQNKQKSIGWITHVNPWLIRVNVWQKPLQYCKVISLQLIKINGEKYIKC